MNGKYMKNKINMDTITKYVLLALNINFILFPILFVSVITLFLLESVTYPNFVDNHFVLSVEMLFIMCIESGLIALVTYHSESNSKKSITGMMYQFMFTACILVVAPLLILLLVSSSILSPYRDSILIGRGILYYPHRITNILFLVIYYISTYTLLTTRMKLLNSSNIEKILALKSYLSAKILIKILYHLSIMFCLVVSVVKIFPTFKQNSGYLIKHPFYSYDEKMRLQIGPVYDYYSFVKKNTKDNSFILKPTQQGRWPDISNEGFTRYFLYPRKFISEENINGQKDMIDYVFLIGNLKLHRDEELDRWPDFDVPAKRIILYSKKDYSVYKILDQDYDYDKFEYPEYWGVIEIDKNKKW